MRRTHPAMTTVTLFEADEYLMHAREPLVKKFPDGSLLCTFTSGAFSEPLDGNFTMFVRSEDGGGTFTKPDIFTRHPYKGIFTTEMFTGKDGSLYVFFSTYTSRCMISQDMATYVMKSTDNGRTFSPPFSIPGGANNLNIRKGIITRKGTIVIPCTWQELSGSEWCAPEAGNPLQNGYFGGQKLEQRIYYPDYPQKKLFEERAAWTMANHTGHTGVLVSRDDGKNFTLYGNIWTEKVRWIWEPSLVELSDGTLVMLMRAQNENGGEGRLWESRSCDGGLHWSEPLPTDIPDPASKGVIVKDGDGTIYFIHNPNAQKRSPLSVWVSRDDMKFWDKKTELVADDDCCVNYPDAFLDGNKLCFVWDDWRHIYYSEIPLAEI